MVTKTELEYLVDFLVPRVYKPVGPLANKDKGPVLAYVLLPQGTLRGIGGCELMGLTISWREYWRSLGADDAERWKDTFNILLWEELSFDQLKFTLLHEVGHVDWRMGLHVSEGWRPESREMFENEEVYASCFALDRLTHFYGHEEASRLHSSMKKTKE